MTTKKHWAADEAARDRVKELGATHGLDSKGILEVLDVKKIEDFKGTEVEAVACIVKWAQDNAPPEPPDDEPTYQPTYETPALTVSEKDQQAYFEACSQLPETPVIAWTVFQDARGFEWSYTIHAGLPANQATIAHELTAVEIATFHQEASRYGWEPLIDPRRVGNGGQKAAPALSLVPPSNNGDDLTFQATQLVGSMTGGKTYWNVLGPRFPQYGVRIWPEVLKASGFDAQELDPSEQYPLDGYVATYVEKEKDGKIIPDKVVSLTKAA